MFDGPGRTSAELRRGVANGDVPEELQRYVSLVRENAHEVVDTDIERLVAAGYNEDQIFEITIAVATGVGLTLLDVARRAIAELD